MPWKKTFPAAHLSWFCPARYARTSCVHVQAAYFEQKFYATFFLAPEPAAPSVCDPSQRQHRSERTRSADSRSPRLSPRDQSTADPDTHQPYADAGGLSDDTSHTTQLGSASMQPRRESAGAAGRQTVSIGQGSRSSTPDLSPRGDLEADDPPTPRMYKAIVPTAGPSQASRHHNEHNDSQGARAEGSQMVLHQGHYDHARGQSSPRRHPHAHHSASQQAVEGYQQSLRCAFK